MNNQSVKEIHDKFVEDSNKAKVNSYLNHIIENLTPADKEGVEMLAKLDDMSGGNLSKLYQAYQFIKNSA